MPEDQIIFDAKYLRLVKRKDWEFVHRKHITGIVGIIAITEGRELVLVEQFRIPLGKPVIEIPAGLVGDTPGSEHESLADAANRELEEETGYHAGKMRLLTTGASSAGLTDELITLFLATGLTRTGPGGGDPSENITVHVVPLPQVPAFLARRAENGAIIDLKVYSALYFASQEIL